MWPPNTGLSPRQEPHSIEIAQTITTTENERWIVYGDVVILSLNVVGALFILGNMFANEIRRHAATTRMRIVQALIISDVLMGIIGLIGSIHHLASDGLKIDTAECDGLGVLLVAILWSQHMWTLSLAFATFMILTKPLHRITSWIEKYWNWSWLFIWSIAFGVSVLGFKLYGYEPSGGICYWGNNSGLFGELIQFIPRGIVFLCIALIYGRLFVFLKRPDKIRTGYSDNSGGSGTGSYSRMKNSWFNRSKTKSRRRFPFVPGDHKTVIVDQNGHRVGVDTSTSSTSKKSALDISDAVPASPKPPPPPLVLDSKYRSQQRSQQRSQPADDIPPWERIELPAFQVDGHRYGGPTNAPRESSMWGEWRGFGGNRRRPNPAPGSTSSVPSTTTTKVAGDSPVTSPTKPGFDKAGSSKNVTPTSGTFDHKSLSSPSDTAFSSSSASPGQVELVDGDVAAMPGDFSLGPASISKPVPALWPMESEAESFDGVTELRRSSAPSPASEPVVEAPRRPSLIPTSLLNRNKPPMPTKSTTFVTPSETESFGGPLPNPTDIERDAGLTMDEDDEKWDLKRMLEQDPPHGDDPFAVTNKSDNVEYVPESMASYLNRKTALLMLWFPLGYVLLFSVSLIRLIYDFTGNPPAILRAISRWMIFGQGLLDALIYGLVEWHTKRVVRRRVRKGTFSPRTSHTAGSGIGSHLRALSGGRGSRNNQTPTASRVQNMRQSQLASRGQSPSVSFVDPEASIMQRLEPGRNE